MEFDETNAPRMYTEAQQRLLRSLRSLTRAQSLTQVAACPGWTVKDVMAHVSGLVAETLAGVPLPRGSAPATARQVRDRAEMDLAAVCDEWAANADAFAEYGAHDHNYVAALTSDLVVHSLDIAETLDLDLDLGNDLIGRVATRYARTMQQRVALEAGVAVTVEIIGDSVLQPPNSDAVDRCTLRVAALDLLLSLTGRRSRTFVNCLDWKGDRSRVLEQGWSQYGPLTD